MVDEEEFAHDGFVRVPKVLSQSQCTSLLAHIDSVHSLVLRKVSHRDRLQLRQKLKGVFLLPSTTADEARLMYKRIEAVLDIKDLDYSDFDGAVIKICEMIDTDEAVDVKKSSNSSTLDEQDQLNLDDRLGPIHSTHNRWDMKLSLSSSVVLSSLQSVLRTCYPVIRSALGTHPSLVECSSLISEPGCGQQPLHSDTSFAPRASILTVFVLLGDVTEKMGPTVFLPRTHADPKIHRGLKPGTGENDHLIDNTSEIGTPQKVLGMGGPGTAYIMDSRLLHAGGANFEKRRVLFYFSVRRAGDNGEAEGGGYGSTFSLMNEFRGLYFVGKGILDCEDCDEE